MVNVTIKPNKVAVQPLIRQPISPLPGKKESIPYDHNQLGNRNLSNQHPIAAITGLQEELNKSLKIEFLDNESIVFDGVLIQLKDFDTAENKTIPIKKDGILTWVSYDPDTDIKGVSINGTLLQAINNVVDIPIATLQQLGVVKGGTNMNEVAVNAQGVLELNDVGVMKLNANGVDLIIGEIPNS